MREKFDEIIKNRKKLHPNDPAVELYWDKLTSLLSADEDETTSFLINCTEDDISWVSEVMEDIIEKNPSKKIISCYDDLNVKFPNLDLGEIIELSKEFLD